MGVNKGGNIMPRIARKDLGTNYYHIIVQGINREYIFDNNKFIEKYIELITKYRYKYEKVKIIAYCIMSNHVHILIYCEDSEEMGQFMKCINTSYARFYNKEKSRVGYVFEEIIANERLLKEMIYYLVIECKISKNSLEKILNISRFKITKLLN